MLLDEQGQIISSTRRQLCRTFEPEKDCQIVVYPLSYNNWTLVNMIPVKNCRRISVPSVIFPWRSYLLPRCVSFYCGDMEQLYGSYPESDGQYGKGGEGAA
ncbi:MAG: hypothetical protein ACLUOI_30460 [Eisenbergiella sp.]